MPTTGPDLGRAATRAGSRGVGHQHSAERRRIARGQRDCRSRAKRCTSRNARRATARKASGKPADPLVGGIGSLATDKPVRTVGSYWPYATTLFDYTRRAMPTTKPLSLSNDEVYAVTAYVLYLNGIIAERRGDERADAAAGEDAEPRRVHRPVAQVTGLARSPRRRPGSSDNESRHSRQKACPVPRTVVQ